MANATSAVLDIIPVAVAAGVATNVVSSLSRGIGKPIKTRKNAGGFFDGKDKDKFGGFFNGF